MAQNQWMLEYSQDNPSVKEVNKIDPIQFFFFYLAEKHKN